MTEDTSSTVRAGPDTEPTGRQINQYDKILREKGHRQPREYFSLHLEFQVIDENQMAFRMAEYCIMLLRRYQLPVRQMLAILGSFGDRDPRVVIESIVKEIIASSKDGFSRERYLRQLLILSNLRKLAPVIRSVMESITKWFKKGRDVLYLIGQEEGLEQGIKKGEEKKTLEFIKALLLSTTHTIPEIAGLVNVPESFVLQVKTSLQS